MEFLSVIAVTWHHLFSTPASVDRTKLLIRSDCASVIGFLHKSDQRKGLDKANLLTIEANQFMHFLPNRIQSGTEMHGT